MTVNEAAVETIVRSLKQSKKYRDTHEETIRVLATEALQRHKKVGPAEKAVRKRLHSIMAPYLGDPDYEQAAIDLTAAFATGDSEVVTALCRRLLSYHLSTQERLPVLEFFYRDIFSVTGAPDSLLDIACGLGPLAFPWMGLSPSVQYYAYDIHEPRVNFLNHYFRLQRLEPLARVQDVALDVPQETADVALFLKEMPRFERNYPGRGRALLLGLRARHLVVTFPTISTHGGRNLTDRYRAFFYELIAGCDWPATELLYDSELVFCVDKGPSSQQGDVA